MTKSELMQLFTIITAAFPNMQVTESMVSIWYELLEDIDFIVAQVVVKKLLLESPYPPTIADIRKQVVSIMLPRQIDPAEAWGEVLNAIHRYGYYRQREALSSMSPLVAKAVQYMGWQEICMSEELSVIRGQFIRIFQQMQERQKQEALLPAKLKNEIQKIAESGKKYEILMPQKTSNFGKENLKALTQRADSASTTPHFSEGHVTQRLQNAASWLPVVSMGKPADTVVEQAVVRLRTSGCHSQS